MKKKGTKNHEQKETENTEYRLVLCCLCFLLFKVRAVVRGSAHTELFNVHRLKGPRDEKTLCLLMAVFLVHVPNAAWSRAGSPEEELIQRAGNADSDAERLTLLKQLRALPELSPALAADADKLIAFVDKWVEGKNLHFYSAEASRGQLNGGN